MCRSIVGSIEFLGPEVPSHLPCHNKIVLVCRLSITREGTYNLRVNVKHYTAMTGASDQGLIQKYYVESLSQDEDFNLLPLEERLDFRPLINSC